MVGNVAVKGANLYKFVDNAPIRFFDSLGLDPNNPACKAVEAQMLTHSAIAIYDESFGNLQGWAEEMAIVMQLAAQYEAMGCNDPPLPPEPPVPDLKPCYRNTRFDPPPIDPNTVNKVCVWATIGTVTYWICSEGSRVLFPPRNLIPIP
jgi:hypothetical protein